MRKDTNYYAISNYAKCLLGSFKKDAARLIVFLFKFTPTFINEYYSNPYKLTCMADIKNMEGLTVADVEREIERGGKFVYFQYCISILILTFRRSSNIYFIRAGESTFKYGIGFTLLTLLVGWWGIPWGPIYTIGALVKNIRGGENVTQEIMSHMTTPSDPWQE